MLRIRMGSQESQEYERDPGNPIRIPGIREYKPDLENPKDPGSTQSAISPLIEPLRYPRLIISLSVDTNRLKKQ